MSPNDEAPVATFRALYSLLAWASVVLAIVALIWLVWTLFANTPTGTARSKQLEIVRPTVTALAANYGGAEHGAGSEGARAVELPSSCAGCHKIEGTKALGVLCPDLTHIGSVAAERIGDPDYTGNAESASEYIRESILTPNAFIVAGETYEPSPGNSLMLPSYGAALTDGEIDDLVAYLSSLE